MPFYVLLGFGDWALGVRVEGYGVRVSGFGFGVLGFGFWVSGFRFRIQGFGFWALDVGCGGVYYLRFLRQCTSTLEC